MTTTNPFVRHAQLGIGRISGGVLRFFDSPASDEVCLPLAPGDAPGPVILERRQRVWWHDGTRWLAGYVDSDDARGHAYVVDFPNGRSLHVLARDLYVRWANPLADPVGLLEAGTVESRFLHTRRSEFLASIAAQRSAAQGLAGVWSAAIELHAHQVGAVRRILSDPVRRYLLADEVGLGKTIEAGMVIRQLLHEEEGEILVIAPAGLVDQWRQELASKFHVDEFGDRVRLHSHEDIHTLDERERLLVVVDEAHRITALAAAATGNYAKLCRISHACSGLLLLSATPVRSNEDGFLRMLHLLDPANFPLDGIEEFRRRVAIRDDLAGALSSLSDDSPLMFLAEPIDTLRRLLPHEEWLCRDLEGLEGAIERRDAARAHALTRRIRNRISETHRIHQRMIRTRRGTSLTKHFPVRGRTHAANWLLDDTDERRAAVLQWVDEVRAELAGSERADATAILRTVLGRASAPVIALANLAAAFRGEVEHDLDESEAASLATIAGTDLGLALGRTLDNVVNRESGEDRFTAMIAWVWPHVGSRKVAVACSYPSAAAAAAELLEAHFGQARVVRLLSGMSASDRAAAGRSFANDPSRTVIVLDREGEEGVNLQVVDEVLHLDLPMNVSRIEQRLGRFDRWARGGSASSGAVRSVAFRDFDPVIDAHLGAWRRMLDEGVGVFTQSGATLQYVLPDHEQAFLAEALEYGLRTAAAESVTLHQQLAEQRRLIEGQDLLDAIEELADDEDTTEAMRAADGGTAITQAFRGFAVEVLGFRETVEGAGIRFGVSSKNPPRVTESDILLLGAANLRRRYAPDRTDARNSVGLLRWGAPLVDRLTELAERDDRGRAFAEEILQHKRAPGTPPIPFFYFEVLVTPDLEPVDALRSANPASAAAAQVRLLRCFPPRIERVWWSPEHGEPSQETQHVLTHPRTLAQGENLGSRPERFTRLTSQLPWHALCESAAREALALVAQRPQVSSHLAAALQHAGDERERDDAIRFARGDAGLGTSGDVSAFEAIASAVANPQMVIDACGVVFITAPEA